MPGRPKTRAKKQAAAQKAAESPKPPATESLISPSDETVFTPRDLEAIIRITETASPEEFQKVASMYFRRLLVRGLANVPVPRTIKELQALADLIRKGEGIDGKGNGGSGGLVAPRVVSRGRVAAVVEATEVEPGVADSQSGGSEVADSTADDFEV